MSSRTLIKENRISFVEKDTLQERVSVIVDSNEFSTLSFGATSNPTAFVIDILNSRVGVGGIASPQFTLDVSGGFRFTGTISGDGSGLTNIGGGADVSSLFGLISSGLSSVALFTSNTSNYYKNTLQDYSTAVSTVALFTSNTSNYFLVNSGGSAGISSVFGTVSSGLSTVALFTSNTSNYYSNTVQDYSTAVSTVALFTSNTSNYFIANAGGAGTSSLFGIVSSGLSTVALFTSNTSNYYSNTVQDYSTAVSTVALFTSNTSNYFIANAGGAGTSSLFGVVSSGLSTVALFTSNTSNYLINTYQGFSTAVSTVALFTSNTSNFSRNILQDFSTPISTFSTLLSQQITTSSLTVSSITFGSGDGFLIFPDIVALSLSTFLVNTSSITANVIQGDGSRITNINAVSSLSIQSTVQGLGTYGYISTQTLVSSLQGLGNLNYISSSQLISSVAGLTSNISSFIDVTELTSTIVGLGTFGYFSTIGIYSTVTGLYNFVQADIGSTIVGLGTAGFISTIGFDAKLASTTVGLGTAGYVSTLSNVTLVSSQRFQASSFTGNYADAFTMVIVDL